MERQRAGGNHLTDALVLTQHEPVYTLGSASDPAHLGRSPSFPVHHTERGGEVTYHGPGQLTAYPIIDLHHYRRDVHWYMRSLEEVAIRTLDSLGLASGREPGLPGVWVGGEKVCAVGVKLSRWVAMHGLSLNVDPDLNHYDAIVPCGIAGRRVTSIAALLGSAVHVADVAPLLVGHFADVFGAEIAEINAEVGAEIDGDIRGEIGVRGGRARGVARAAPRMCAPADGGAADWGAGRSQEDFMRTDECIVVDYNDAVIGGASKRAVHTFNALQPKGTVHRAFSAMLFDADGRLLLQRRAMDKVTFPGVWTNTACSHPLHGQTPSEVDPPREGAAGEPVGVQRAAVRKLRHELGIDRAALDDAAYKYMGRVHYWAADTLTHGPHSTWGEHEIDYLLLVRLAGSADELQMEPNAEEVMDVRWVDAGELRAMMDDDALRWSPWFREIARQYLYTWWVDLDATWRMDAEERIYRFDAPREYRKGDGSHDGAASVELEELMAREAAMPWDSAARRELARTHTAGHSQTPGHAAEHLGTR